MFTKPTGNKKSLPIDTKNIATNKIWNKYTEHKEIFVSDAATYSTLSISSLDYVDRWLEVVNKFINIRRKFICPTSIYI